MKPAEAMKIVEMFFTLPYEWQEYCFEKMDAKVADEKHCRFTPTVGRMRWTKQDLHVVADFVARYGQTEQAYEGAAKALGNRTSSGCKNVFHKLVKGKM
jgi:hypothetical protein